MSKDDARMEDDETEAEDVVETPVVEAKAEEPAGEEVEVDAEEKSEEAPAAKADEESNPVPSMTDDLLKEVAGSDPMKAALIEKAIEKEAQRRKDEWAGREANWIEKADRKAYAKNPAKWIEDRRKIVEYDKLREEVESLRKGTKSPESKPAAAETPVQEPSVEDEAKKFVAETNLDEAQTPLIAALFKKIGVGAKKVEQKPVDVAAELARIQFEKERSEAESDEDFKTNEVLQALAWKKSHGGMSPMEALAAAKKQLGIKPRVVTKVSGSPVQGKPAFAKATAAKPAEGTVKYDGKTDPMKLLKKKYGSED